MAFSSLDSALLGPLFATRAMADVFSDRARLAAMLRAETALARAEAQFGLAPTELAQAIERITPEHFDLAALGAETAVAGVPVIPFVKAVQKALPQDLERAFHKGATTQDIADTSLVLVMRDAFALIAADFAAVMDGLAVMADAHRDTPCIGRTYLQHAAPVTFGFKVAGWLAGVTDVAARLPELRDRALTASLAGPVGTLAALGEHGPAVSRAFADALGLRAAPVTWHTRRAVMAETGAWLAVLAGALGKIAADVAHLVSTEVGECAEPHVPGRGGSSAMPHKRNPVSSTVILAAATAAPGHVSTLFAAMTGMHERPAGAWHAEWHALPQLFGLVSGALAEARRLAEGLEIDSARMRRNIDLTQGLIFADAAAGLLAGSLGRAAAHHHVEEAAARVRASGGTLAEELGGSRLPAGVEAASLAAAFDLAPAVRAAAQWVDPVLAEAARVRASLAPSAEGPPCP